MADAQGTGQDITCLASMRHIQQIGQRHMLLASDSIQVHTQASCLLALQKACMLPAPWQANSPYCRKSPLPLPLHFKHPPTPATPLPLAPSPLPPAC
jgi:hypothetical protein